MGKLLVRFLHDQSGATAIEYAVAVVFISLVLVAAAQFSGLHERSLFRALAVALKAPRIHLTP